MSPKELVKNFYESDLANCGVESVEKYFHKDCTLNWNSSKGFTTLNYEEIKRLIIDINKSYDSVRMQISHLLEDGDFVTSRYTLYTSPIEDVEAEEALAHFITIWEVKDGKLFRGFEVSQLADDSVKSRDSFKEIKV
ncbi:MAG: hypothetical protein BM564_12150 [Bacteroidetes bacterium MedPE-SWsnd-G2]|nr:MAG: hypothetical protein BM564_12150 [Bacteroidetes bacterium MedPE-SWsnd-G2]